MGIAIGIIVVLIISGVFLWGLCQRLIWQAISKELSSRQDIQILDIQISRNNYFIMLASNLKASSKIYGIVSEKQALKLKEEVQKATVADRAKIIVDDMTNLTFTDHSIDCVIINNLHQVKPAIARGRVLQEAIRILDGNGMILIVDSQQLNNYRRLLEMYGIKNITIKRVAGQKIMQATRN